MRPEPQVLNKSGTAISNACAEIFLGRSSIPFYHGQQNAYPIQISNEKKVTSKCKDVWVYLRESSGSAHLSYVDNFKLHYQYFHVSHRIDLLAESGITNAADAKVIMKKIYPLSAFSVPGFHRGNPRVHHNLGSELHQMGDPADKIHLCAVACRGAFSGLFTWSRFNAVLIQGGWPWLRRYSRAYARTIYTAMVLIFVAIECYNLEDLDVMRTRLLSLAAKLVGSPDEGMTTWRVRQGAYLKGEKISVPTIPSANAPAEKNQTLGRVEEVDTEAPVNTVKDLGTAVVALNWSYAATAPTPVPKEYLPSHIATGRACNHKNPSSTVARVKLAASIEQLADMTTDNKGLTVTLTAGDRRAQEEVLSFVVHHYILTVYREEGQCVACAISFARCIGALVVIL